MINSEHKMRTMQTGYKETELLEKAIDAFYKTTGMAFTIEGKEVEIAGHQADAVIRLNTRGVDRKYIVEVKRWLTPSMLALAINQVKLFQQKGLIATDYVNPKMADRLKELDMPFIDTVGNAYLNEPPVYVFIKGNKPPTITHARGKVTRAFQPTGLKLVFVLLCNQDLVNAPYRDIQKAANVALGTVHWVMRDLREEGYILDMGKRGKKLMNKKKMLEKWVEAYNEKLKPKLLIGRYKANQNDWWRFTQIQDFNAYWGGEIAAAKLTEYLKPQIATIYTRGDAKELILKNKLFAHPQGNIEILDVFWRIEYNWNHQDLVPPLLIYADLIATGDDRNLETAKIIYEREIARYIRED